MENPIDVLDDFVAFEFGGFVVEFRSRHGDSRLVEVVHAGIEFVGNASPFADIFAFDADLQERSFP